MRAGIRPIGLLALLAGGCLPPDLADRSPIGAQKRLRRRAGRALQAGIRAYNQGKIVKAQEYLESVLKETKDSSLAYIRAGAHFYLAAIAWDMGQREKTSFRLKLCHHADPGYAPDWTFISPGLRRRFESLKGR